MPLLAMGVVENEAESALINFYKTIRAVTWIQPDVNLKKQAFRLKFMKPFSCI
jgi:hypothetical protein